MPEDMQQFLQRKHLEAQARMRRLEELRRQPKRPPTRIDADAPDAPKPDPATDETAKKPPERPASELRKVRIGSRVFRPSTIARRITSMAAEIRQVNEEARRIREDITSENAVLPKRVDAEEEDARKRERDTAARRSRPFDAKSNDKKP